MHATSDLLDIITDRLSTFKHPTRVYYTNIAHVLHPYIYNVWRVQWVKYLKIFNISKMRL